ncbi:conserved Plasmodium protein, unknown function [Plasmodium knowlesi strain H]|uniref:Clu domain-containing protein n=3 Tax=Plasmodium knowlesi TaxID=5850 RepID=A0A5K1VAH0_PLAKH|nr:conserved Plasmodium protein, unknown function [Plasmodium knowlesi strain H]OTN67556.1 Uncharacterized protein PKNOH_S06408000 [Plasmodium knowlesi]CAA9987355.1 conserved Plasmodium protein, unknown function [Plasmodium knowlesi strain H]SBO23358.1 conserved Plasmodium protein, unknown function [Plasmodium knowlesi strain H]SBO24525.1 conserved Plasmodium protein, unknown function [Plasmodium knowlesi strain H]VVS76829.1 conserved Plasmodium protein, unknown function [Plasmodium knowlesi s|eukprot:XP_002258358.1 hypothetical protein, conserved in Plasmodium species [Plasmodium knowlesi strain H]
MHTNDPEFKSHFALKVKLKALHFFCEDLKDVLKLKFSIYYDGEEEKIVRVSPERVRVIEVFNRDYNTMLKSTINKSIYLPIACLRGNCPQFINIICSIGKGKELGLKLYLNKNYAFLKYYGRNKLYSIYDCDNGNVRGHLELAIDIVNCNRSVPYFGKEPSKMGKDDHYILATHVSVSKLWKEMVRHKTDRDVNSYVESFRIMQDDALRRVPQTGRNTPLSLFGGSVKHAYEQVPIPLISASELFNYFYMEVLPLYKKGNSSWINVVNHAYDMYLYRHFEKKDMYEEIRACALFFYLESVFVKVAASFAKSVIIQEYTKYTSPTYVDKLFAGKPNHRVQLDDDFKYQKISGEGPLDVFKLFDGDEVYVTHDSHVVGEGLIGILIFGDHQTDTDLACKTYNREIKAQQWINKGIAKIKSQNLKGIAKECGKDRMDERVSLSLLSFNLSALVSYKGFKMYVIPSPPLPLTVRRLDAVNADLKNELRILERAIPTYGLLTHVKGKKAFLMEYHSEDNYVFYNINTMFVGVKKRHFPIFEEPQRETSDIKEQNNHMCYREKSFYSNDMKVRGDLDMYCEEEEIDGWGRGTHGKNVENYIERVLREIENLSFNIPFDSTSLKMYLHGRGLKMKHLGKMLSCVSLRWLYDMVVNEILIRCIKKYVYICMREICLFCKRRVSQYDGLLGRQFSADNSHVELDYSVVSELLSDEVGQIKGEASMSDCYDSDGYGSTCSEMSYLHSDDTTEGTSEWGYTHYEKRKRETKRELCSRKKALKSFIGMRKVLSRKVLLRTHLESVLRRAVQPIGDSSNWGSNSNGGNSLLNKLLNFDRFKKHRNGDMYILKRKKMKGDIKTVRKEYRGNVTLIDMFVVNMFNLIFVEESGVDGDLLSVLQTMCAKFFHTNVDNSVEASQKNYLYSNLQPCLGISFYRASFDQRNGKRNQHNGRFFLHDLKAYSTKIKSSLNVTYMDLPTYKYTQRHERIPLHIVRENKKILSHAILFTIMYYHHLSASNEVNTTEYFLKGTRFPRMESCDEEDLTSRHDGTWTVKLSRFISLKDNVTFYSESNYLPLYGFLNMVAMGIQLGFFESTLKRLIALFRCIPEDSIISVHVRIMWLYMYALKGRYLRGGYILGDEKPIENMVEESYKAGNRRWVPYPFRKNSLDEESTQGSFISVSSRGVFLHDDETTSQYANYSAFSDLWSDPSESGFRQMDHGEHFDLMDEDEETDFHSVDKLDLYKGTQEYCSVILNNYFVFFHPLHLDFYLSLAWYNRSVKNYREFLLLLRTAIFLQLKMRMKNQPGERIEDMVNLTDNFENLVYLNFKVSSYRDRGLKKEKEYMVLERIRNVSSFFLNSICYPHEDSFLHATLETTMKYCSVYSMRLGFTVHHFVNSLFYYYYTNTIIRKYRNENFIMNGSLCCISVLEHVRGVYQSFGEDNVYVGEASLDLALMALKTYFTEMPEFGWNCVMAYSLANAQRAAEIFRRNLGINHPDTLHSHYVLSLVYMYLDSEKCLHIFEEIIYHLLNYKYTYGEKNILNRVYCYVPDFVLTDQGVDSRRRIPNGCRIKWYLLHSWFSISMPIKYLKKIRRILFLLVSVERCRRRRSKIGGRRGSNKRGDRFEDEWVKKHDDFLRGNVLWACSKDIDEEYLFPYEQLLSCIRGYRHIFPLERLFSQMEEYNDLLKFNKNVVDRRTSRMNQCEHGRGVASVKVTHNEDDIRLLPLLLSRVDTEQNKKKEAFLYGFVKSSMKHKKDFANYVHHPDFRNDEAVENYIMRETQEGTKKRRKKSITDYYLKKLIKMVEQQVEFLYKEEKYKHDTKLHLSSRTNKGCTSLSSQMGKRSNPSVVNKDVHVLMSLLYHFLNVEKFHLLYSRAADGELFSRGV